MQIGNSAPTTGRVASFGHRYRDEMAKGEKRADHKRVRRTEKAQFRAEAAQEMYDY